MNRIGSNISFSGLGNLNDYIDSKLPATVWFTGTNGQTTVIGSGWDTWGDNNLSANWNPCQGYGPDKTFWLKIVNTEATATTVSVRALVSPDSGQSSAWAALVKPDGTDDLLIDSLSLPASGTVCLAVPKSFRAKDLRLQFKSSAAVTVTAWMIMGSG